MTPGDCGTVEYSREEISRIRKAEAAKSSSILNGSYHCLECDDAFIMYDRPTLLKAIELVRKIQPTIVFTTSPSDYMVDHEMAGRIAHRQREGAKTLNFVGGEPTMHLHGVLELLNRVNPGIKVVWNSNMYYNDIVDEMMAGLIDVYLADFKCGNNTCAEVLLRANNYVEVVKRNILKATGRADVIVRHIVLPGHSDCCLKPILAWLRTEIPNVKLSLRDNYVPPAQGLSAPRKYMEPEEMRSAEGLAKRMGLKLVK